jgi:hypothetical protein
MLNINRRDYSDDRVLSKKPAPKEVEDLAVFLENANGAIDKIVKLKKRLETDPAFKKLWEENPIEADRQMGIDPKARTEVGLPMVKDTGNTGGPECNYCITPAGNACHC